MILEDVHCCTILWLHLIQIQQCDETPQGFAEVEVLLNYHNRTHYVTLGCVSSCVCVRSLEDVIKSPSIMLRLKLVSTLFFFLLHLKPVDTQSKCTGLVKKAKTHLWMNYTACTTLEWCSLFSLGNAIICIQCKILKCKHFLNHNIFFYDKYIGKATD